MKRVLFTALVIAALLLSLAGTVAAAPPVDNPGKGPPDLAKDVFIHYRHGAAPARGGIPGPPEGEYKYNGIHWADEDVLYIDPEGISGVPYYINLTNSPVTDADALTGINVGFQTWEDEPNSYMDFGYYGTTDVKPDVIDPAEPDYTNVVGWEYLTAEYGEGVIAVTLYWYNILTEELVDVDIAMNTGPDFRWSQSDSGETWTAGDDPDAFDVDIQNIMAHEAGHDLVLHDLYADYNSEKTMYGIAAEFELKKRSLDPGDEAGIQAIYPITEEALTGTITGTVTEAATGDPIGGATVAADGYTTMTASDGTYTLADMPVGSYTVTASATGYIDQSKTADVLENQTTFVDFVLTEAAAVTGTMHVAAIDMWYDTAGPNKFIYTKVTIVDADSVAVPEATVYLEMTLPDGSTASGSGGTNGDGTVTFKLKSRQTGAYISTVTDVVKDGWTYDSGANLETSETITVP